MKSTTVSAVGLALFGTAQAGVVSRQAGFTFSCNGKQNPDTDDCNTLFQRFTDGTATYNHPQGTFNTLIFNDGEMSNCQVEVTFYDREYTVTGNQIFNGIDGVGQTCFSQRTGGSANEVGGRFAISVRNNPDFVAAPPAGGKTKRNAVPMIPQGNFVERRRTKSVMVPEGLEKRADDDTSFRVSVHTTYATPGEYKTYVNHGLGGTSTWEWNESMTVSETTTISASVSAGIEGLLSTQLGTEISTSNEYSSGTAQTMTVVCNNDQVGQVYFQGYAQIWRGSLQPSNEGLTIQAPMLLDGKMDGYYQWECTQK